MFQFLKVFNNYGNVLENEAGRYKKKSRKSRIAIVSDQIFFRQLTVG